MTTRRRQNGGQVQRGEGDTPPLIVEDSHSLRRDRLLSSLNLMMGVGLFLGLPFALRAGAQFFLPVTTAIVIAIILVPSLEWLERRRVPSGLSAFLCVAGFLAVANAALAAIIVPASNWLTLLPQRVNQIRETLAPLLKAYMAMQRFADQLSGVLSERHLGPPAPPTVNVNTPNTLVDLIAMSAPGAILQMLFGLLLIYFFLATYTRMRRESIRRRDRKSVV